MTDHTPDTPDTLENLIAEFWDNRGGGHAHPELYFLTKELKDFIQRKHEELGKMRLKWHMDAQAAEGGYAMAEDYCKLTRHLEANILGAIPKEDDDDK